MSDAPIVYVENGVGIYRASATGMCERALIAARMGMTPAAAPEWMQEKYREGHEAEDKILREAERVLGVSVTDRQQRVEIPVGQFAVIRGHIDGRAGIAKGLVEAKAFGPSLMAEWRRGPASFFAGKPGYRDQLTIYWQAFPGLPAHYAVMDKETGEITVTTIPEPPGNIDEIVSRILRIELAGRKGSLPRECNAATFPCPFYFLPGHGRDAKPATVTDEDEFETLAQEACEAKEDKQRAEARAKEANKRLLEYMNTQDSDKLDGRGYVANRISSSTTKFNREAMRGDGVYEKYLERVEYQYATAKRKE